MPQFAYRARDAQGGLVEGVLDCADRAVAIRQIELQHCIPIRIEMVDAAKPRNKNRFAAAELRKIAAARLSRSCYADAKPENSAQPIAHFHRATRASAASRHDARRSVVGFGKTVETPARSPNDAHAAPGAGRWPQFFAGPERDAANFPAAVCKSGGCRRGERCVAANSAAAGETS